MKITLTSQKRRDLPGMTRNRDIRAIIIRENVIKHLLRPDILIYRRLGLKCFPKQICFGKASLDPIRREVFLDICFAATAIARMPTNALSKQLLDFGNKGWEFEAAESYVGGGETTSQRTCVITFWGGNLLNRDFGCPKSVGDLGLCDAVRG